MHLGRSRRISRCAAAPARARGAYGELECISEAHIGRISAHLGVSRRISAYLAWSEIFSRRSCASSSSLFFWICATWKALVRRDTWKASAPRGHACEVAPRGRRGRHLLRVVVVAYRVHRHLALDLLRRPRGTPLRPPSQQQLSTTTRDLRRHAGDAQPHSKVLRLTLLLVEHRAAEPLHVAVEDLLLLCSVVVVLSCCCGRARGPGAYLVVALSYCCAQLLLC